MIVKQVEGHACRVQIHAACRYSLDSKQALAVEPLNLFAIHFCVRTGVHTGWVKVGSGSAGSCWPGLGAVCELLSCIICICRYCLGTTKSFLKCAKDSICSLSVWNSVALRT